eukprot:2792073-Pyramimonas_sp.AAC.1
MGREGKRKGRDGLRAWHACRSSGGLFTCLFFGLPSDLWGHRASGAASTAFRGTRCALCASGDCRVTAQDFRVSRGNLKGHPR